MCRLFGLRASAPARATFWLLDAPDSLVAQSRREPDGAGIGYFDVNGDPIVDKEPIAAWRDATFATDARTLTSSAFVAHVRYASTGRLRFENTHPFVQDGRIFAHNGAFTGLDRLDRRLAELGAGDLVQGETDSERMFALITAETSRCDGDVEAGLIAAVGWIVDTVPVLALNLILATADRMWALRYPDTHELFVLRRPAVGRALDAATTRIHARSKELADHQSVVLASEPMDGEHDWQLLRPGELLRIDPDLSVHSRFPFPAQAKHVLTVADLDPTARSSQL